MSEKHGLNAHLDRIIERIGNPEWVKILNEHLEGADMVTAVGNSTLDQGTRRKNQMMARRISNVPACRSYITEMNRLVAHRAILKIEDLDKMWSEQAQSDLTEILQWDSEPVYEENPETGEEEFKYYRTTPYLLPMEELTPTQRKSIKKISKGKDGLVVELHDKSKAMESLARRNAAFTDNISGQIDNQVTVVSFMPSNNRGGKAE